MQLIERVYREFMSKYQERLNSKLIEAAKNGLSHEVISLARKGANVNARCPYSGESAYFKATLNGHIDTAEVLLKLGADVELKDSQGNTAFVWGKPKKAA